MAGLGLLFAGLSGAGKALASAAEQDQRVADQKSLEAERSRLEEQKAMRIDEMRRQRDRAAALQQGQDIDAKTADLQNQRDADAINAANGSQMTAADAAVLRNNPAARKAYGLLGSTRQTDLEDRATAAEKLGYLDAAKETRGQLQTEFVNQRTIKNDENADKRLDAEVEWRKAQADLANKREDRMARIAEAELSLRRSQAAKADSRESMAAEREARMATVAALKGAESEVKQLSKDLADPMLAPEQKAEIKQQLDAARRETQMYRRALGGAGIDGGSAAPSKPFDPADFPVGGAKSGTSKTANPFSNGVANPAAGEISEPVERRRPAATEQRASAPASPGAQAAAGLDAALAQTARQLAVANSRGDRAEIARLSDIYQQQVAARQRVGK